MTSTPHPKPLHLPEPHEVLLNKVDRVDRNVQVLHPLLHLLDAQQDGKESLGDRLAKVLLEVRDSLERTSTEMAELKQAVISLNSSLKQDMSEIASRMQRTEQLAAEISRVLNLKLD